MHPTARLAAAVMFAILAAACGGSSSDQTAETDEPFVPRLAVVVETATPDPLLVPDELPDGFVLDAATIVEADTALDHFILFGEADQPDLADGKQLLVGFFGSSVYGLFDCHVEDGDVDTCGSWTVAPLSYPDCIEDCAAFVMGRNVTEDEVANAAANLTIDGSEPSMADEGLPVGVTKLVDTRLSVYEGLSASQAQSISHFGRDGRFLSITAVDGGDALADVYRFFIDADGTTAPFDSWRGDPGVGTIRRDGETVIAVLGGGFSNDEIEAVADSMQRGGAEGWEQLRQQASDLPLEELLSIEGDDPVVAAVGGRFSSGQWAVVFTDAGDFGLYETITARGPDPDDDSGSSGGAHDPGSPDEVTLVGGGGFGGSGGFVGNMYDGLAPNGTATVTVMLGEQEFEAEVGEPSTLPEAPRIWAVFVESPDPVSHSPMVAIARDANGNEIGRASRADP